jgi:hypothetical protein
VVDASDGSGLDNGGINTLDQNPVASRHTVHFNPIPIPQRVVTFR